MRAYAKLVPVLFERHRVRARVAGLEPGKRTEQAARDTHIGRLEPDVVVVERSAAVALLAFPIGEPANCQQIGFEQPTSVGQSQPLTRIELVSYVEKVGVSKPR